MHSQIGQAIPGQTSNPILAAIGKESGNRNADTARDRESFQSVLAGASGTTQKNQADRNDAQATDASAETEADSDDMADDGVANAASDEAASDDDAALNYLFEDADEIVFQKKTTAPQLTSEDVIQLVAQAAKALETNGAAGQSSQSSEQSTTVGNRTDTSTPAWFSTSRAMASAGQTTAQQANAAAVPAASSVQADTSQTPDTASDEAVLRAQRDVTTNSATASGQPVKQDIKGTETAALSLAQTAGKAIRSDEEPKHVTERRNATEAPAPTFATQRQTVSAAAGTQAFAAPLQVVAHGAAQGTPAEDRGARWVSEAGFTSDIAAQDMPATSRVQQTALLQQPDLPRNIAVQIAQAMRQGGADRPMELVLSPAELGRVRISMQAGDGAMTVHVMADRPETLDLMRRHIDLLAQEFHEIGYGTAEFAFGQNAPDGGTQNDGDADAGNLSSSSRQDDADGRADTAAPAQLTLQSDRVDIRL